MQAIQNLTTLSFSQIDVLWLSLCIILMVFLQAGLSCAEAGAVRCKNNINVAMKNCLDFGVTIPCFLLLGFPMMFVSFTDFFTVMGDMLFLADTTLAPFVMVNLLLCVTTITIISGAVVERISLAGFMIISVLTSAVFFPVVGSWIWGGDKFNGVEGWLSSIGFHDFAGATVVHSIAGWIALAAIMVIGPRLGRFGKDAHPITASSLPLLVLGVFLIWIGFIGAIGANAMRFDSILVLFIMNMILAGILAMSSAAILCVMVFRNLPVQSILNAGLGGLVASSACIDLIVPWQAMAIGMVAGVIVILGGQWLEKLRIDDGVGVIPVHLMAGTWGTTVTGFLLPVTPHHDRFYFIGVQVLGAVLVGGFVFCCSFFAFKLLSQKISFRVSKAAEMVGLNIWEHGASTSRLDLLQQLSHQARSGDFSQPVSVEPQTEEQQIAWFYNSVREKFHVMQTQKQTALDDAIWLAQHDPLTSTYNRRAAYEILAREHERVKRTAINTYVIMLDIDHFKRINDSHGHDVGDEVLRQFSKLATSHIRKLDLLARIGGEEFLIVLVDTTLVAAIDKMEKLRHLIMSTPYKSSGLLVGYTVSMGLAELSGEMAVENSLKIVDSLLYQAKQNGRNCLKVAQPQSQVG